MRLGAALLELLDHVLELVAEEDRDDRRRGLVGPEPVVVVGADAIDDAQQLRVLGDGADDGRRRRPGTGRCRAGCRPGSSRFSPVSVDIDQLLCLPEPLMPANGFSCSRQTRPYLSAVLRSTSIDQHSGGRWRGCESSKIGAISYWLGATSLCRVLTGTPSLNSSASHVGHARQHALGDGAEVLVFQLLALGRRGAEERAAAVDQVRAGVVEVLVDQEVFLLGADGGEDLLRVVVAEQLQDAQRLRATAPPSTAAAASSCRAPRRSSSGTRSG